MKENKDNWLTVTYESDFYSSALYPPDSDNRSFSFLLNSDSNVKTIIIRREEKKKKKKKATVTLE